MSSISDDKPKEMKSYPELIIIISGKRKSGKDYIANKLRNRFRNEAAVIIHLSEPLKSKFAEERSLEANRLMDSSSYKENFREEMIKWGKEQREKDPHVFCRAALTMSESHRFPVWIISDVRYKSDLHYFQKRFCDRIVTIRITASTEIRERRGWVFKSGVDDVESECDLDHISSWNFIVENNDNAEETSTALDKIFNFGNKFLSPLN